MYFIQYYIYKLYFKYYDTKTINHYKLLLILEKYKKIGIGYFKKYPDAEPFINLNDELFIKNNKAKKDFIKTIEKQNELENEFYEYREIICTNSENSQDFKICSKYFEDFYVGKKYHFKQSINNLIKTVNQDIIKIESKKVKK